MYKVKAAFFCIIVFCSCAKSWLDKKPSQSLAVPSTLEDYQFMMNNTAVLNDILYIQEIASDGHTMPESFFKGTSANSNLNAYTWSKKNPYLNVRDWIVGYKAIVQCNVVLEGIDKINPVEQSEKHLKDKLKGEALFFRSYYFYQLAQIFSPEYITDTQDQLSIPLRLTADINAKVERASVEEVYNQIVKDLIEARKLLPLLVSFKTHPSANAAGALLSRVFLSMENYELSGKYADSCLQFNRTLMDYNNDNDLTNSTNSFNPYNKEVIFHGTCFITASSFVVNDDFFNTYSELDLRKKIFYRMGTNQSVLFRGSYGGATGLFFGLANDELYLIRSECSARKGDVDSAMADLNYLLKKRWTSGQYSDQTAMNEIEALKIILSERKKELFLRGIRWTDLRRLNHYPAFSETLSRTAFGENFVLEPGSYKYTFPLPDDVISISNLQQNTGWE